MQKKRNQLFRIIEALKPTEKAYFKKFGYKQEKQDSVVLALFAMIDRQMKGGGAFSEEKLVEGFEKKYPKQHYTKTKSRLLEELLDALRDYDKKNNEVEKIYDCLAIAESLNKRNLFHDAWNMLQKAEKLAEEMEQMELLILIKSKKYYYEIFTRKYQSQSVDNETIAEILKDLDTLKSRIESDLAAYRILHFQKSIGVPRSAEDLQLLREIQEHPAFDPSYSTPLQSSRLNLAVALSGIFFSIGDTQSVVRVAQKLIDEYQAGDRLRKLQSAKYLSLFDSFLQAALLSLNVPLFEKYQPIFQASKTYGESDRHLKMGIDLYTRAIHAIVAAKPEAMPELVQAFDAVKDKAFIPNYRKVSLAFYMSFGPFLYGDHAAAYAQIQWIKNNQHLGLRYDIEIGILSIECVILMERGEVEVLEYRLRAFDEFLKKKGRKFEMEAAFVQMVRNSLSSRKGKELDGLYAESLKGMKAIVAAKPAEAAFLNAFDVISWLQSKVEGRPFQELYYKNNIEGHLAKA